MRSAQISLFEIFAVVRRRWKLLILPPLVVTILCTIGAFVVPRMYESSTRILIQRTEVANPLTTFANAMSQMNEDPLRFFDEIIFSQHMLVRLIDSLELGKNIKSEVDRRVAMDNLKQNVQTKTQARESFSITYFDTDPQRAKRGAEVIANIFIQTVSSTKNQRNEMTVQFYEQKLDEFRAKFEQSQSQIMESWRSRNQGGSGTNVTQYTRIDQADQQIRDIEKSQKDYQQKLDVLRRFPAALATQVGKQNLFELQRSNTPYAQDLRPLLATYVDVTQRYTMEHPEVVKTQSQILAVLERMGIALGSEIEKQNSQLSELRKTKEQLMNELLKSSEVQQADRDKEANYALYQRLYNEMKVKLEEAQISRVLGKEAEGQFMIIDPALVPLFPSKPSRAVIIVGGLGLGILLGFLFAILTELFDTTIRNPKELEVYRRPVIALLPEWKGQST